MPIWKFDDETRSKYIVILWRMLEIKREIDTERRERTLILSRGRVKIPQCFGDNDFGNVTEKQKNQKKWDVPYNREEIFKLNQRGAEKTEQNYMKL